MKVLFIGLGLFFIAFLVHMVVWRIKIPKLQTNALLRIFSTTLTVAFLVLFFFGVFAAGSFFALRGFNEYMHIALMFIFLMLTYIITYSALEVDSPSLVILNTIAKTKDNGLDKNTLFTLMTDNLLVKPRLDDLIRDGFAYLNADKYVITKKGSLFVSIFILYRKLLGINKKGG